MKQSNSRTPWVTRFVLLIWIAGGLSAWGSSAPLVSPQSQAAESHSSPSQGPAASGSQGKAPGGAQSEADANEYKNYRLNMNSVNKYMTATKAILKLMSDNPTLREQLNSQHDVPTIDEAVKTTEKYPELNAAIETAGLTTREYVVMSGTLTGAMMAVDMKKQGQITAYPTTILPENLTFVEKNYEKLKSMMKTLQTEQDEEQ